MLLAGYVGGEIEEGVLQEERWNTNLREELINTLPELKQFILYNSQLSSLV